MQGYKMTDYNGMSSDDLVNWRDEGIVFSMSNTSWGSWAWAQQVIARTCACATFFIRFPGESNVRSHRGGLMVPGPTSTSSSRARRR